MTTVAERIATTLGANAKDVFGLMGNGNAFLIDAMLRLTDLRFTAVRHEAATVASADAYHRATRELAVATATYGAGFTNTLTALTDAAMSRTPLVLVVGDAPTSGPRPWDIDQVAVAKACGAPTIVVTRETPGRDTRSAVELALQTRGPVVLAIPYDLPSASTDEPEADFTAAAPERPGADAQQVAEIASLLGGASRPVILAGRGAREARSSLTELADRLGAVTVTSAPARGMFVGRKLDAGVCGGFSSDRTLEYLGQADVILAVGASLNQFTMGFNRIFREDAKLIQIDLLDAPTSPKVTHFMQASAASTIEGILAEVAPSADTWPGLNADEVSTAQFARDEAPELAEDGRLDPRSLTKALDERIPEARLIASDGGHFIGWANTHLSMPSPDSIVLVGTQFQSIGLGFSSAPGAAIAANDSDRMLVLVTGDGGGLMAIADLDSTVRTAKRATVVVYNDASYTAEVTQYGQLGLDETPMLIEQVDFTKFAEGVGARGTVVRSLADLDEWAAWAAGDEPGTWLLDCRISNTVVAPYQREIMDNLKRQTQATVDA
ncbi:thiamine pyrophosphate-binding protein [Gulosibacter molinativorax]|uniref:Thiamine pyrophosphate-binding protein n=1 Tax=Gulosibacter molinativorax TaxID=256821 RepID=A0ABT7C9Y2_9MICO|nr:thiamine pyrophosphate-binding protein [Gulosibacter molinativorax]MDJ1372011.1 thiamine pyrophosphate-binding protein [Gulosibacter molinativorax]QUY60746.1 Sulfoacetaldehyde acetyltransferase [Gulosibacter molinativorax]